ncbi:MAG: NAD-dependent deacylase [Anaerolineae bacterium]|nr:NAD-dependent deacylase [Anaerolineae bacterium]MCB9107781.1 NAD-dependent deacylase [Anaerolineales bacterium]
MSSLPIPSQVIETLRSAGHVAVLTGAGVSAESNIPTFRDAQTGLWAKYSPEELATPQAFRRNPQLVWDWYAWRRELVSRADPNPGHFALVELAGLVPKLTLITQNVDGLHQRAGSDDVIELHGSITRIVCSSDRRVAETWSEAGETPPRCPDCDSYLRPDVVWFGEALPTQALHRAFQAAETCDLFLSVGTSALVHPAASLPFTALERRTPTIEINPDETPLTPHATFVLPGPSGQILPALVAGLKN